MNMPEPPDREDRKVDVRSVLRMGAVLIAGTALAGVVCAMVLDTLEESYRDEQRRAGHDPFATPRGSFPEPRIQVRPWEQRREVRASENDMLTSYAWEDRAQGVVRIPIDRAIERMSSEPDSMGAAPAPAPAPDRVSPSGAPAPGPAPDGVSPSGAPDPATPDGGTP